MEDNNNKEYSELFEIGDYKNDYFLIFGNGHVFIPKIKEECITNEFKPYMVIYYYKNEDYKREYPIELHISLYDYKIMYPKNREYSKYEWDSFFSWIFIRNYKFKYINRDNIELYWNKINPNIKFKGDTFSNWNYYYYFENKLYNDRDFHNKYNDAYPLFHPIADYNLCKNVRFWMVYENNPIEVLKKPHIRAFYTDDYEDYSIELAISLLSDRAKIIYENSIDYYKNNINEYKKKKKYILNVFNKWKLQLYKETLICSNIDKAKSDWARDNFYEANIEFPSEWKNIGRIPILTK